VRTNVLGTQNIINVALAHNVEKVVNISTDKVTNTINTMGATKLLAERLVASAQYYKGKRRTIFASVRFGNVIGSNGSVINLFRNQIINGGPITLTHPDMTRFIMSIPQAITLVFEAVKNMQGGEIFIFKMPVIKLKDLLDAFIEEYAPQYGFSPEKIKTKQIGLRAGEKMYEDLMTVEESYNALENEKYFIVLSEINIPLLKMNSKNYKHVKKAKNTAYSSKDIPPLTKEQLKHSLPQDYFNERLV
jgi:FlaA1/EpsC-like NDP-sugar epimerase